MSKIISKGDIEGKLSGKAKENILQLFKTTELVSKIKASDISFSQPFLCRNDSEMFYPNTLNIIQGQSGSHKSRLAQMICSVLIRNADQSTNLLGLSKMNIDPVVLYVDTERNITDQLPFAVQKIIADSGYDKSDNPTNLDYVSLLPFKREDRFVILKLYLELLRHKVSNHLVVVLDVLTDCLLNFNSPEESMRLIDLLNDFINAYNTTFLCVIHENPGTEKARGHAGTELMNKASSVIQVKIEDRDRDIIKISNLKNRNSKPFDPFHASFNNEVGGLVEIDEFTPIQQVKVKAPLREVGEFIIAMDIQSIDRKKLLELISKTFNCGERIAIDRIASLVEDGFLEKAKNGRKVIYNIKIKNNEIK